MARTATILPQSVSSNGLVVTFNAATASDAFVPGTGRVLLVNNASGASINVTFPSNLAVDGLTVPDRVVALANGKTLVFETGGQFNESLESDGTVWVNYSALTSVTVALVQL